MAKKFSLSCFPCPIASTLLSFVCYMKVKEVTQECCNAKPSWSEAQVQDTLHSGLHSTQVKLSFFWSSTFTSHYIWCFICSVKGNMFCCHWIYWQNFIDFLWLKGINLLHVTLHNSCNNSHISSVCQWMLHYWLFVFFLKSPFHLFPLISLSWDSL